MSIIPRPLLHEPGSGALRVSEGLTPRPRDGSVPVTSLRDVLAEAGIPCVDAGGVPVLVDLSQDAGPTGSTHPERYTLRVGSTGIELIAAAPVGLHHGARSLVQLIEAGGRCLPHGVIHDEPRYRWRGLSVDIARHFFGPAELRRVVDLIARYKMNVLHLHLTDDQGWRLESPSRPALTAEAAGSDCSGGPGGFLTVGEFAALQEYAADRFVTVVPEIDVPGHTNAATHAYGELRPDGVATDVYTGMEVGFSTLSLDLPATEPFLRDVFADLAAMTSGPYLHYGGDEAMSTDKDEYARFIELCDRIVRNLGKTPVAWNEAATGPVSAGSLLQYWDTRVDLDPLRRAVEAGARVILSPGNKAYLDMKYTADYALGQDWAGLVELRDAYDWDPADLVDGLAPEAIEGVEGAIWTETLASPDDLMEMLLPRLAAVAEVAWSDPGRKDFDDFRGRVAGEATRAWEPTGLAYHRTPQVDWAD